MAEGHEEDLVELAGEEFLADVREAHGALGKAMGLEKEDEDQDQDQDDAQAEERRKLAPVLTRLAHAIGNYARVLVGDVDFDEPDSVAMFQAAMAPRDAHSARQSASKPSTSSGDEAEAKAQAEAEAEAEAAQKELLEQLENPLPPVPEPGESDEDE